MNIPGTQYKVRARIPAEVARETDLVEAAAKAGITLAVDENSNVEGAWDATLLTLDNVMRVLREIGLSDFMIERSVISVTVTAPFDRAADVQAELKAAKSGPLKVCTDTFSADRVFNCEVSCERAPELYRKLSAFANCKVFGVEAFQVVSNRVFLFVRKRSSVIG
ncbi:MAG: hypothetical protein QME81_20695, partial [bacterium]|nr:hypothetical protein [bacterium]